MNTPAYISPHIDQHGERTFTTLQKGLPLMDSHAPEYAAAVAGMNDTYGRPLTPPRTIMRRGRLVDTHAVGDYVGFRDELGNERQGYVLEASDDDTYMIRCHLAGGGQEIVAAHIDSFLPF